MRRLLVGLLAFVAFQAPAAAQVGGGVFNGPITSAQIATALGYTPANGANYCALSGCTMAGDLKFTDATYDIGKSGATRPRNIFASGTGTFGSTLTGGGSINATGSFSSVDGRFQQTSGPVIDLRTANTVRFFRSDNTTDAAITAGAATFSDDVSTPHIKSSGNSQITLNSAGNFTFNNNTSGNGASFNTNTNNVFTFPSPVQLSVVAMTQSSAAQSGAVCYNTTGGTITYDATLGCLASSERFKTDIVDIDRVDALKLTMALTPVSFRKRVEFGGNVDRDVQVGFIAEQVADVDERLVSREADGTVRGVRYQQTTAILAGAIQELKREIDTLRSGR